MIDKSDLLAMQKIIELAYRFPKTQRLDDLSSEDLSEVYEELASIFPNDPTRPGTALTSEGIDKYSLYWLSRIRNGVYRLSEGKSWSFKLLSFDNFWLPRQHQTGRISGPDNNGQWRGGLPRGHIKPTVKDVLYHSRTERDYNSHRLAEILASTASRIHRCPRPECGRVFVKHGRQRHCSPSCANLVRVHRYRSKQDSEAIKTASLAY